MTLTRSVMIITVVRGPSSKTCIGRDRSCGREQGPRRVPKRPYRRRRLPTRKLE